MKTIQIGLLLPASTIFPISKVFETGLKNGLGTTIEHVELIREFIGQGSIKQTGDAINKLFNYDDVDIITGILSGKVTESVSQKFLTNKKPFVVSELGEYVPNPSALNNYIFINSHHMWQHAWALGNWGVKTFGKKGMFIGGVYDAAYSFSHMFNEGMMAADGEAEWSFSVPPMPPPGKLSDMSVIFPFLDKCQPDFVFATFCGEETTLFLHEFIKRGWHKKTKLLGLPFLLDPFKPLDDDITIYTTLTDSVNPGITAKESFYSLGYMTGIHLAEAIESGDIYKGLLSNQHTLSLGKANFMMNPSEEADSVAIVENTIYAHQTGIKQKTIARASTFSLRDEKLGSFIGELNTGWLNPYLCI